MAPARDEIAPKRHSREGGRIPLSPPVLTHPRRFPEGFQRFLPRNGGGEKARVAACDASWKTCEKRARPRYRRTMCHADASHSDQLPSRLRPIGSVGASTSQAPWGSILLASMLSSIFFAAILSKPPKPTRVSAPAKPTQSVDKTCQLLTVSRLSPASIRCGYPRDTRRTCSGRSTRITGRHDE